MKKDKLYEVRQIESIRDMLVSSCDIFADRTAYLKKQKKSMPYEPVTYAQFKEIVWNFGTKLLDMGFAGKKVAIISENRYEWCISYMGVVCGDMTVVPIDRELAKDDIKHLIEFSESSAVIYTGKISDEMKEIKSQLEGLEVLINMDIEDMMPISPLEPVFSKTQ